MSALANVPTTIRKRSALVNTMDEETLAIACRWYEEFSNRSRDLALGARFDAG